MTRMISESGFTAIHEVTNFFWAFMIVATGLTILKTLAVSWLAIRSRRDRRCREWTPTDSAAILSAGQRPDCRLQRGKSHSRDPAIGAQHPLSRPDGSHRGR